MTTKIFARVTDQGTAASETAVCEPHLDLCPLGEADVSFDVPIDCTGNEMLECQVCGAASEG